MPPSSTGTVAYQRSPSDFQNQTIIGLSRIQVEFLNIQLLRSSYPTYYCFDSDILLHIIYCDCQLNVNPRTPKGVGTTPWRFPCNFFDDSNRKIRLILSVTRDGEHILTYVISSWRCHVTYVMTSYVHDGGQNTLVLPLLVKRDIDWCRCDKVMRLVSISTKLRS